MVYVVHDAKLSERVQITVKITLGINKATNFIEVLLVLHHLHSFVS